MNDKALVSIVLATFNGERYLTEQIESILAQTHQNLELIISDDCSDDTTLKIARVFSATDSRIRIISNEKRLGVGGNFFKALHHCRGAFICFCDQDDYWRHDKVALLLQLIEQSADTMMVYSDLEVCDDVLNPIHASFWQMSAIRPVSGLFDERILLRNLTPGCSMMFRRAVMEKMMGFPADGPFLHDHPVFVTSCGMGRIFFTKEKLVKYRQHQRNVIGVSQSPLFDSDFFLLKVRKLTAYVKSNAFPGDRFDLERIAGFCDAYAQKRFCQLRYLRYYLFIHPHTVKGIAQAFCECLLPKLYSAINHGLEN